MPPIDDGIVPGVGMCGKAIHGWVPQGEKMRGIRQGAPLGGVEVMSERQSATSKNDCR